MANKSYKVTVERTLYQSAVVEVSARNSEGALKKVEQMIEKGTLPSLEWDESQQDDSGIRTTGDIE